MSKRCLACDQPVFLADVHCQRCGAAILPPPPAWLANVGYTFRVLIVLAAPLQLYLLASAVLRTERGSAALATLNRLARFVVANGGDIAGVVFAYVLAPLVALFFALQAMVDVGDWLDLKMQQWRAERFRKYGW